MLQGAACATSTTCFVVGRDAQQRLGVVVPVVNGVARRPRPASATALYAIDCPSATKCIAVGGEFVVPIVNGLPRPPIVIQGADVHGIPCASATTCILVGANFAGSATVVSLVNDTPGPVITLPDANALNDVACPSATRCEAVAVPGAQTLRGVACTSGTACTAVGGYSPGVVVPLISGVPGAVAVASAWLNDVACPTSTTCVAGGRDQIGGAAVTITSGTVGAPHFIAAADEVYAVACATAATCVGAAFGSRDGVVVAFSP